MPMKNIAKLLLSILIPFTVFAQNQGDDLSLGGGTGGAIVGRTNEARANLAGADAKANYIGLTAKGDVYIAGSSASGLFAEDAAHTSGDKGQFVLGVVNSNAASLAAGEQDYVAFALGNKGTVFPDLNTDFRQSTLRSPMKPEDEAVADTQAVMMAGGVRNETAAIASDTQGDASIIATNRYGAVNVVLDANLINSAVVTTQPVRLEDAASASGDAGLVMLAQVTTAGTAPSSSTNGDYVTFKQDIDGRLNVNAFGSNSDGFWSGCSASNTGTTDIAIKTAVASNRIYVTSLSCFNTSAVASSFTIKDGASTVLYAGGISNSTLTGVAYWEHTFGVPLRGSVNTALNFLMAQNATATTCCAAGFISGN